MRRAQKVERHLVEQDLLGRLVVTHRVRVLELDEARLRAPQQQLHVRRRPALDERAPIFDAVDGPRRTRARQLQVHFLDGALRTARLRG